jgi:hypothetical protein
MPTTLYFEHISDDYILMFDDQFYSFSTFEQLEQFVEFEFDEDVLLIEVTRENYNDLYDSGVFF